MKRATIIASFVVGLLALVALSANAQTAPVWNCNGTTGTFTIAGTGVTGTCPAATNGGNTGGGTNSGPCSESQVSTALGGKTFKRQCVGSVIMQPSAVDDGIVALTDLGSLFGGKPFPNYLYSGQSPTFYIDSGYYVALAFTPNANGLIKFTANNSYGDGGAISLSTFAGGLTYGAPGVICALTGGGLNSMIVSTTTGYCPIKLGQTYYINLADTNANGDQLCFGGTTGACTQSRVSYAFTARSQ